MERRAIDMAVKVALAGQPKISGSKVAPTNAQAHLMTLFEANKQVSGTDRLAPTEVPLRQFPFILDANTGAFLQIAGHR